MNRLYVSLYFERNELRVESLESNPRIVIWSSLTENKLDIQFEQDKLTKDVVIDLGTNKLELNSSVYFELRVTTINEMFNTGDVDLGTNQLSLFSAYDTLVIKKLESKKMTYKMPYEVNVDETKILKGILYVSIDLVDNPSISKWRFKKPTPISAIGLNNKIIDKLFNLHLKRITLLIKRRGKGYLDITKEELAGLFVPFFESEVGFFPSIFYFIEYSYHQPDEKFFENLLEIELLKNDWNKEDFISVVNQQFDQDKPNISLKFLNCLRMFHQAIASLSHALPYFGDIYFNLVSEEAKKLFNEDGSLSVKNVIHVFQKFTLQREAFRDALEYRVADCEDSSSLNHHILIKLEHGIPELKDDRYPWSETGSYKSELVKCMQKLAFIYVPLSCFMSVSARNVTDSGEGGQNMAPVIDSDEFNKLPCGGHCITISIPLYEFENMINRLDSSSKEHKYLFFNEKKMRFKWEQYLPVFLGEGTGELSVEFIPWKDMGKISGLSDSDQELLAQDQQRKLLAYDKVMANSNILKQSNKRIIQKELSDTKDTALSTFYRLLTTGFTSKFIIHDINITQCLFIQQYQFNRKTWSNPQITDKKWSIGLYLKDIFYKRDWCSVLLVEPLSKFELDFALDVAKHFRPRKNPISGVNQAFERMFLPIIKQLNEMFAKEFTRSSESYDLIVFYIDTNLLLYEPARKQLVSDLISNKSIIIKAELSIENLTIEISRILLRVWVKKSATVATQLRLQSNISFNMNEKHIFLSKNVFNYNNDIIKPK